MKNAWNNAAVFPSGAVLLMILGLFGCGGSPMQDDAALDRGHLELLARYWNSSHGSLDLRPDSTFTECTDLSDRGLPDTCLIGKWSVVERRLSLSMASCRQGLATIPCPAPGTPSDARGFSGLIAHRDTPHVDVEIERKCEREADDDSWLGATCLEWGRPTGALKLWLWQGAAFERYYSGAWTPPSD